MRVSNDAVTRRLGADLISRRRHRKHGIGIGLSHFGKTRQQAPESLSIRYPVLPQLVSLRVLKQWVDIGRCERLVTRKIRHEHAIETHPIINKIAGGLFTPVHIGT